MDAFTIKFSVLDLVASQPNIFLTKHEQISNKIYFHTLLIPFECTFGDFHKPFDETKGTFEGIEHLNFFLTKQEKICNIVQRLTQSSYGLFI